MGPAEGELHKSSQLQIKLLSTRNRQKNLLRLQMYKKKARSLLGTWSLKDAGIYPWTTGNPEFDFR